MSQDSWLIRFARPSTPALHRLQGPYTCIRQMSANVSGVYVLAMYGMDRASAMLELLPESYSFTCACPPLFVYSLIIGYSFYIKRLQVSKDAQVSKHLQTQSRLPWLRSRSSTDHATAHHDIMIKNKHKLSDHEDTKPAGLDADDMLINEGN